MPTTLSIKNAPDDVVERLRARAQMNHRSLQGELMSIITQAVQPRMLTPLDLLEDLRRRGVHSADDSVSVIGADRDRDEPA